MMPLYASEGITLVVAIVGAVTGIVGAVLGVVNTLYQRRVKLRVVPNYKGKVGSMENDRGWIEVTNLSAFPITLLEIGFTERYRIGKHPRTPIHVPSTEDGKPFPRRLQSRESLSGHFNIGAVNVKAKKAYVITACGTVRYGTSPKVKEMIRTAIRCKGLYQVALSKHLAATLGDEQKNTENGPSE